ncbi:FadR/GntR family transcriptional regulator [Desulfosarcina ovata]|uniref:GntR family transcriptional regulator n=2 Tax=Desulfosarcina ovata TaxID=83564 RepID=A0A5K8ABA4_9BACT|nr:FadR/GntR family transcriptional regulator [Desulfosarcina ovata]BBO83468.1 GntR family transcriptional regulator [Desulfosarcina ovata subsp. sediminis]BBO89821.1 GntR family transcriptional regulator [Desulfosarcina ovata subsp. ovata]
MNPLFRAAKQNRIFQDVVEQIQEAIIQGRLKVGDRLPAERELKEMLQTSRSTLREALRVLEQKGLIEIKLGMGGGAVVKAVSSDMVAESLDLLIRSQKVSLRHIAEFRERVEGDVVELATRQMTESDRIYLKNLLEEARQCVNRGTEAVSEFLTADKNIHLGFAKLTGNPIYISILKTIHENIRRYYDEYLVMEEREMNENFKDLEDVVAAMEAGDAKRAGSIARAHVSRFNGYMETREQQNLK